MAKKNKGSLDTNILLRIILDDVPEQRKPVAALLASGNTFEIADAALFELIFVLEKIYKMDRELVAENVIGIVHHPQFNCNTQLFSHVVPLYISQKKLSIIDCALLVYAELNKAVPLYSFDKELVKAGKESTKKPV